MSDAGAARQVRMEQLAARWAAADGRGPVPGTHTFERAEDREDPEKAELALTVAPGRPALRVTLDELQAAGRPIPVLLPDERTLLEQRADADPEGFDQALSQVQARARSEADRLRLLFDLERLAAHLPAGLAAELSAAAAAVEPGPDATEAVRSLRGRLLDGLTRSAGG